MSDIDNKVKMIVEGLLLASGRPLSINDIAGVFQEDERPDRNELKQIMSVIQLSLIHISEPTRPY